MNIDKIIEEQGIEISELDEIKELFPDIEELIKEDEDIWTGQN